MRKGSTRFPDVMRQTGGGRTGISHKPSKKVKTLRSVAGMDKLPKKLLDNSHTVNLVTVPKKLRSVLSAVTNKRYSRCEMLSTDGNKKGKLDQDEQHSIMKNEEEAVAGLLALAGNDNTEEIKLNNKISDDVKKDCKDITVGNESRKRCSSHVYICHFIRNLKITKGKTVISDTEAKTETTPENVMNVNAGIDLNEAIPVSTNTFVDQSTGCGAQSYFGNLYCDPSQWSRPMFPKQQMWMNPFMYNPLQLGSYVQTSLHNVLGSKHQPSTGYDENGAMFCVDSHLTLKLAL